ncbi:MAG TPA: diphthine--ammonia ligase [Puia sp.]|nr:diphthine--ammonia ligase [Puia sp.]
MTQAFMNWSGGKDSAFCLHQILQSNEYQVSSLLTSVNAVYDRVSMHGVRRSLLEAQSLSLGIPVRTIELPEQPEMNEYEEEMMNRINELKNSGCTHAIFGDIFLEDLRRYREEKLGKAGIQCLFPLWRKDTAGLVKEFIALGFKAIIVCINEQFLSRDFCGRIIDEDFLPDLPESVDPCGENGEFHSFVFDGPLFHQPVSFRKGNIVYKKYTAPQNTGNTIHSATDPDQYGFYFCDLLPAS